MRETVPHIQAIDRHDWELIILPSEAAPDEWQDVRIRIIPSGVVGPGRKRDMGAEVANGEILVFLDDDSYPEPDFLDIASPYFEDESVVALGGPGITPPQDDFWQRVSGAVFLSKFSGGAPERYVPVGQVRSVDDWPSVNLMVRRRAFLDIGGFNSPYWPGEDTKLCMDLIKKTDKKVLYVPQMKVWHHRREGLVNHLKQIGGYGLHRGYFAKKYPEMRRKLQYFIPSVFVLFVITSSFIPILWDDTKWFYGAGLAAYCIALLKAGLDMFKYESLAVSLVGVGYTVATHLWYGIRFMQGLFTKDLVSRLR